MASASRLKKSWIVDGGQRAVELLAVADESQSDQCARYRRADIGAHDDWYRVVEVQRPGADCRNRDGSGGR